MQLAATGQETSRRKAFRDAWQPKLNDACSGAEMACRCRGMW